MKTAKYIAGIALLVLLLFGVASGYDGPMVVDDANLLAADELLELQHDIEILNSTSEYFLVILTTPSVGGQDIEKYSRAIMKVWKIGHEGTEDGLLVVLARDDKLVHFEFGPNAKGVDAEFLESLKTNLLLPALQSKNYKKGLTDFVASLESGEQGLATGKLVTYTIIVLFLIVLVFANTLNRKRRKCPNCGSSISAAVGRCPACLHDIRVAPDEKCPCGSGKSYESCCLDYHLDGRESLRFQMLRLFDIRYLVAMSTAGGGFTAGGTGSLPKSNKGGNDFDGQSESGSW